jgi:OmpA-OmpF porin, OOP family
MKTTHKFLLAILAATSLCSVAHAQSKSGFLITDGKGDQPYILTGEKVIERDGTGNCLRSTIWSKQLALSTKLVNAEFPAGCYCEAEYAKEAVCLPPPVVPAPVPAPAPAPAPAAEKVNIPADALFAFNKAEISEGGQEKLAAFADRVTKLKSLEVVIAVGHADRIGSDSYNQALSEKRANAVKDFLVSKGVPANRVYVEGKGKSQPVTGNECRNLGAENGKNKKLVDCLGADRRVELEAVGVK